jgi:hypothetical protein
MQGDKVRCMGDALPARAEHHFKILPRLVLTALSPLESISIPIYPIMPAFIFVAVVNAKCQSPCPTYVRTLLIFEQPIRISIDHKIRDIKLI